MIALGSGREHWQRGVAVEVRQGTLEAVERSEVEEEEEGKEEEDEEEMD